SMVDTAAGAAGQAYRNRGRGQLERPGSRKQPREYFELRIEVEVNRNLTALDRYLTLVHELAHVYCGHLGALSDEPWPDREKGSEARDEIEAESIAYAVVSRLGQQIEMGDYILEYAQTTESVPADVELRMVARVTGDIEAMGKARLPSRPYANR
ncbi:hypothetical protein, partial [Nocardioides aquaticus]